MKLNCFKGMGRRKYNDINATFQLNSKKVLGEVFTK